MVCLALTFSSYDLALPQTLVILILKSLFHLFCRELLSYTDVNKPLAETDWDIIAKSPAATLGKGFNGMSKASKFGSDIQLPVGSAETKSDLEENVQTQESVGASEAEETHMALKMSFTLPASCYATMAIRELLKISSSVAFHKALSILG